MVIKIFTHIFRRESRQFVPKKWYPKKSPNSKIRKICENFFMVRKNEMHIFIFLSIFGLLLKNIEICLFFFHFFHFLILISKNRKFHEKFRKIKMRIKKKN